VERVDEEKHRPIGLHSDGAPKLVVENVWGERFYIHYVKLDGYEHSAAHCVKLVASANDEEDKEKA